MFTPFLNFIFPNTCLECQSILTSSTDGFCLNCYSKLPFTFWKWQSSNEMKEKLNVFQPIENSYSLFYFRKGNSIQFLLHSVKFFNRKELGKWLAWEIFTHSGIQNDRTLDGICPVPIHPKKLRKRGYNQNESYGKALATHLNLPFWENALKRIRHQKSQTKVGRAQRLNRLENTFDTNKLPENAHHILLIDDVCTTGATLLQCIKCLREQNKKVSVLTIAYVPSY